MNQLNLLVGKLDYVRASGLSLFLKSHQLRFFYSKCSTRLGLFYLLSILFYFPISILRPDILLICGPLIFGYPHLIASFRYVENRSAFLLSSLTAFCILARYVGDSIISQLPFGVFQLYLAIIGLLLIKYFNKKYSTFEIIFSITLCVCLICFAHFDPLIAVGGMLILHNWIGFFYWIKASSVRNRRFISLSALIVFSLIHLFVLSGTLDSTFPSEQNEIIFPGDTFHTAWYLASWTEDPVIWYRFLVLYSFGLAIHYFVWLRAIPQSLNPLEAPNNFRRVFKFLREDFGEKLLAFFLILSFLGILVWLFSIPLGSQIYFEVAIMHGAFELIFLFPSFLKMFQQTDARTEVPMK